MCGLKLNTSNPGKLAEYQRIFGNHGVAIAATAVDLAEISGDAISVVVHKACQVPEGVLVEDTSLDIEGAEVGVNVRWLLDHLEALQGRAARWSCLLARRVVDKVYVYSGEVKGHIISAQGGSGFGFDPYFVPEGSTSSLAQSKPDHANARVLAVAAFLDEQPLLIADPIFEWRGPWQIH